MYPMRQSLKQIAFFNCQNFGKKGCSHMEFVFFCFSILGSGLSKGLPSM